MQILTRNKQKQFHLWKVCSLWWFLLIHSRSWLKLQSYCRGFLFWPHMSVLPKLQSGPFLVGLAIPEATSSYFPKKIKKIKIKIQSCQLSLKKHKKKMKREEKKCEASCCYCCCCTDSSFIWTRQHCHFQKRKNPERTALNVEDMLQTLPRSVFRTAQTFPDRLSEINSKSQIVKLVNFQIHTDLWQLLSSLQHVLKVAPSVTVRLQIGAQQIAQGDPTQAEPLLQPLALQRFSWARPAWWDTRRRSVTSTDGLSRRLNTEWAETDMQENQEVLGGRTKEDNWKETIGECVSCVTNPNLLSFITYKYFHDLLDKSKYH